MAAESALDTVDNHWAVRVVDPEDRVSAMRYATSSLNRIGAGDPARLPGMPASVGQLASAYALAGRDWLDFDGSGAPGSNLSDRQESARRAHVAAAAAHAFALTAALPIETRVEDCSAMLHRTLLLATIARVGNRSTDFEQWLLLFGRAALPQVDRNDRWDIVLLRRVVELWTIVLRGSGPSGLRQAMEIIASIREDRPIREPHFLATATKEDEQRLRLHLFSLFHVGEAATDVLLFRLHAEPERIEQQLYGRLLLAREAAAGDPRLDAICDWLFEASRLVVEARTSQLKLLPEGST